MGHVINYEDLDFATCIKSSYSLNKTIRGPNIKKEDLLSSTFKQLNLAVSFTRDIQIYNNKKS